MLPVRCFIAMENYIWNSRIIFRVSEITSFWNNKTVLQYEKQFSGEKWKQSEKYIAGLIYRLILY